MLEITDLEVRIGRHRVVSIESLSVGPAERVGLVGESGAGKSMTAMSIVGLLPRSAAVTGSIRLDQCELVGQPERTLARVRGVDIGVVHQDPLRSLNPVMRVGRQVSESLRLHHDLTKHEVRDRVIDLLAEVQLPNPADIARRYPHQLSGGQRQRVLIAAAIACNPKLLIADEPTTALDATVQQHVLELIVRLCEQHRMALLFVSHDLGVVKSVTDNVAVMYGGRLMEYGPTGEVIEAPRHRYTDALLAASPGRGGLAEVVASRHQMFDTIPGSVPSIGAFPAGCPFRDRCSHEVEACSSMPVATAVSPRHRHFCWNPTELQEPSREEGREHDRAHRHT